jgi:hypothetical protein
VYCGHFNTNSFDLWSWNIFVCVSVSSIIFSFFYHCWKYFLSLLKFILKYFIFCSYCEWDCFLNFFSQFIIDALHCYSFCMLILNLFFLTVVFCFLIIEYVLFLYV